jgi:hypothetical protein
VGQHILKIKNECFIFTSLIGRVFFYYKSIVRVCFIIKSFYNKSNFILTKYIFHGGC